MTAGTAIIMWLGELITDRGIGNGMSLLIFTSIAARFPGQGGRSCRPRAARSSLIVLLLGLAIIAAVVFVEQAPAPHPGAVRQAHDRPPDVRRHLDLHPAEGQPGRCHPGHLRVVAALSPAAARAAIGSGNNTLTDFVATYFTRGTDWPYILIYGR